MGSDDILLFTSITLIIWAVIIYYIIQSATKSKKIERQLRIQNFLLARMAEKAGVSKEDVNAIFNQTV